MPQLGAFCLSPEAAEQATIPRRGSLSWFPHTHLGRGWHCVPACTSWPSPATKWPPRPRQHLEPRGNGCPVSDVTGHVACPSALYLAVPPQPHAQSNQAWMFVPLGPLSLAISQSTGHREVGWGCWWPGGPLGGLGRQNELALAQAQCSWKAPARWGVQPRLCIPRAPRMSAVSICLAPLLFMQQRIGGCFKHCQVLFLKSHGTARLTLASVGGSRVAVCVTLRL